MCYNLLNVVEMFLCIYTVLSAKQISRNILYQTNNYLNVWTIPKRRLYKNHKLFMVSLASVVFIETPGHFAPTMQLMGIYCFANTIP